MKFIIFVLKSEQNINDILSVRKIFSLFNINLYFIALEIAIREDIIMYIQIIRYKCVILSLLDLLQIVKNELLLLMSNSKYNIPFI